jgi:predicted nucleotidyltransferase
MSDLAAAVRTVCQQSGNGLIAAYLFGSRAAGTEHAESDVDVGVLFDHAAVPVPADRARLAVRLGSELIGATHSNRVDVVVLNDAPPELSASVLTGGTRVFCSDTEADRAFRRRTISLAADQAPFLRRMRRIKLAALVR